MIQRVVFISMVSIVFLCSGACGTSSKNPPEGKGLYRYSEKEFSHFLETIGYSDSWRHHQTHVSRNSDGTALRFLQSNKSTALLVTCDGVISEIEVPGYPTWFNDDHHVVAWHGGGLVHYKNGESEKVACAFGRNYGPDPSGKYFIKMPNASCSHHFSDVGEYTEIYSIEQPYQSLVKVRLFSGEHIFFKDNQVFLFGDIYHDLRKDVIEVHIFQVNSENLLKKETLKIQGPEENKDAIFYVQDVSPWNDEVLLVDAYDFPARSVWYVFNLKTHEMKKLGKMPFGAGRGFFLQCDVLQEATKKLKEQRRTE